MLVLNEFEEWALRSVSSSKILESMHNCENTVISTKEIDTCVYYS